MKIDYLKILIVTAILLSVFLMSKYDITSDGAFSLNDLGKIYSKQNTKSSI